MATPEEIRRSDVELHKRTVENLIFWLGVNIETREEAIAFVQRINGPLAQMKKRFEMPTGKVVKVS